MAETEDAGSSEFAERMSRMLNEAALALMVSVGHRTGLFDVMATMPAATCAEIAAAARDAVTRINRNAKPTKDAGDAKSGKDGKAPADH